MPSPAVRYPLMTWEELRALIKQRRITGPVVVHCAEGEPKHLVIPPPVAPGERFTIDSGPKTAHSKSV